MAASPQRGIPVRSTFDLQLTPLLVVGFIVGILSTVALGVTAAIAEPNGPPPGPQQNPGPPPPHSTVWVIVSAAVFVVAWVTVVIALTRDHLARRIATSMAEAAIDLEAGQTELLARLTSLVEVGERRETEAFLSGMNAAEKDDGPGNIHPIRKFPKPRDD